MKPALDSLIRRTKPLPEILADAMPDLRRLVLGPEALGATDHTLPDTPDEAELLDVLEAREVMAKHYSQPANSKERRDRDRFRCVIDSLKVGSATSLREALIRQHQQFPTRLFKFIAAMLRALPAPQDNTPLSIDWTTRSALVADSRANINDSYDLACIALTLADGVASVRPMVEAMRELLLDEGKFRKAFSDLIEHWEKTYRDGSPFRVKDVAQSIVDDKKLFKDDPKRTHAQFAEQAMKLAGVPEQKHGDGDAAGRRLRRAIAGIKKQRSSK